MVSSCYFPSRKYIDMMMKQLFRLEKLLRIILLSSFPSRELLIGALFAEEMDIKPVVYVAT